MAIELILTRPESNISWGFRLTGGADHEVPLTVIKVSERSIAENAGMQVGDLLVRVGDTATAGLTHLQAHDLIHASGNTFPVAVIRGDLPNFFTETEEFIETETSHDGLSQTLQYNIKTNVIDSTEISVETGEVIEQNIKISGEVVSDREDVQINSSTNVQMQNMEQIVEKRTENSEAITEDISSVDFQRFDSSTDLIQKSEVLKVLHEETTADMKDEATIRKDKKWTTFLQKPSRPKPKLKPKEDDKEGEKEPPYRVIIQKQKKRIESDITAAMSSQGSTPIPEELMVATPEPCSISEQEHLEEEAVQEEAIEIEEENEQHIEEYEEHDEQIISEVEMSLEDQLCAIQKQLLALSQLPAAIQQTLDVVTQQLTKIVGPVNEPNAEEGNEPLEESPEDDHNYEETDREIDEHTTELETLEEVSESGYDQTSQQGDQEQHKDQEIEEMLQVTPEPDEDLTPEEMEARKIEQAKVDKKDKEHQLLEDLKQRRLKDRPTLPLTPLQRPICLPGGRKWRMPDDAHPSPNHAQMSDDMIADTISAQTEIITGTTLGFTIGMTFGRGVTTLAEEFTACISVVVFPIFRDCNTHLVRSKAIDEKKINFLKYTPPPQKLDHLRNSEVYRLVHDMDEPCRGVSARSGKAMAEEDYYDQIHKSQDQSQQMKG